MCGPSSFEAFLRARADDVTVIRASLVVLVAAVCFSACTTRDEDVAADLAKARAFNAYPLYWAGDRFEEWELEHVETEYTTFATFVYGDCQPLISFGSDGGCAPPLQIQIGGLCDHLDLVTRDRTWRHRRIRGAPVGRFDGAPMLFTEQVQIKVYWGKGADEAAALRMLRALRSLNMLGAQLGPDDPIPPPRPGVLEGTARFCP
jgi:hypothetical protein